jgi:hypothetical protein
MPEILGLIPTLLGLGNSISAQQHANIPSLLPPAASTPGTTATAPQVTAAANTDYATSGSQGGAAPNFLSSFSAQNGGSPTTPLPFNADTLKGYFNA